MLILRWESKSLCKYCDDAEGKLSFLPHVYLQNIWNPLESLGHELFTFNSRKRRLPVNFTGKGKRRGSKVKGFPKSVLELGTGFPGGSEESACNAGDLGSIPRLGRSPGGGHANTLQYSCPGKSQRQRSLACYSWWGHKESDMTEKLSHTHTHTHTKQTDGKLSCKIKIYLQSFKFNSQQLFILFHEGE